MLLDAELPRDVAGNAGDLRGASRSCDGDMDARILADPRRQGRSVELECGDVTECEIGSMHPQRVAAGPEPRIRGYPETANRAHEV